MKRSIISFFSFTFLVILITVSEITYANNLAKNIDTNTQNFKGTESIEQLKELFESRKFLNRIFLRENITERFEIYISELEVYGKSKDTERINEALEKIRYYTKDLYEDRTF